MAYKALGWAVWKAARFYLRRRFGSTFTKRRALVAGGAVAAGGAAVAGSRAVRH
jgi:hypothetical protein